MFSMQSLPYNPLIATFQLSSAASLNLGQSQNSVLGNGLTLLTLSLLLMTREAFVDSVDQDPTAQNVRSDL